MTEPDLESNLPALEPEEERRLYALLRNAYAPNAIAAAVHERLLSAVLDDPFAPASPEELVESERLRQALDGQGDHHALSLARALSSAYSPRARAPLGEPTSLTAANADGRGKVVYYRFGGALVALAAAAAILFVITAQAPRGSAPLPDLPTLALAQSRSTVPLFQGEPSRVPSARIDRIASLRGRELRDNRYALWGVR